MSYHEVPEIGRNGGLGGAHPLAAARCKQIYKSGRGWLPLGFRKLHKWGVMRGCRELPRGPINWQKSGDRSSCH